MNFYIDFEATQPENEIIAIGVVAENGATFHSLVKPQLSCISKWVSNLTHISEEDLEKAKTIDEVMIDLDLWVMSQQNNIMACHFISYGDDAQFIKATFPAIKDKHAFIVAAYLYAKIEDCSKEVAKFFHGGISLINAFNYIESMEKKQKHNPLEDAIMLQKVMDGIKNREPLTEHPISHSANDEYKSPSGTFWHRDIKTKEYREFSTCEDAITWYIKNKINPAQQDGVHRNRIMAHIMASVRSKKQYGGFKWGRK